jgi:hypothetical protein
VRSFRITAGKKDGDTGTAHLIAPSGLKVRQTRQGRWLVLIIGLPYDIHWRRISSRLERASILKDSSVTPEASSRNAMYEHSRKRFETDVVTISAGGAGDDEHLGAHDGKMTKNDGEMKAHDRKMTGRRSWEKRIKHPSYLFAANFLYAILGKEGF